MPKYTWQYISQFKDFEITKSLLDEYDKDFSKADQIRDELLADGIVLDDLEDGTTTWKKG